jgi:hypothetical protein
MSFREVSAAERAASLARRESSYHRLADSLRLFRDGVLRLSDEEKASDIAGIVEDLRQINQETSAALRFQGKIVRPTLVSMINRLAGAQTALSDRTYTSSDVVRVVDAAAKEADEYATLLVGEEPEKLVRIEPLEGEAMEKPAPRDKYSWDEAKELHSRGLLTKSSATGGTPDAYSEDDAVESQLAALAKYEPFRKIIPVRLRDDEPFLLFTCPMMGSFDGAISAAKMARVSGVSQFLNDFSIFESQKMVAHRAGLKDLDERSIIAQAIAAYRKRDGAPLVNVGSLAFRGAPDMRYTWLMDRGVYDKLGPLSPMALSFPLPRTSDESSIDARVETLLQDEQVAASVTAEQLKEIAQTKGVMAMLKTARLAKSSSTQVTAFRKAVESRTTVLNSTAISLKKDLTDAEEALAASEAKVTRLQLDLTNRPFGGVSSKDERALKAAQDNLELCIKRVKELRKQVENATVQANRLRRKVMK